LLIKSPLFILRNF